MKLNFVYIMYVLSFIWKISAASIKEQESEKEKKPIDRINPRTLKSPDQPRACRDISS